MNNKGSLSLLVLHVLAEGQNHGYQIAKLIKERSEGLLDFKEGTLYPTLHSLEKQKLIESYSEKVDGRNRRYYRITEGGRAMLKTEKAEWFSYTQAVNRVLKVNPA